MAGIGFELQRVLRKGGMTSFLQVALSGVIIVAGPWLLSIIGIFLISRFAGFALKEGSGLFMGVIIYSYAFSLFIFGGTHYIFTRFISDLIYMEKKKESGAALVLASLIMILLSGLFGLAGVLNIRAEGLSHPLLFKISSLAFFVIINVLWLLMIFISLLKRFKSIFVVFLSGMLVSVIGLSLLGRFLALGGAILGFALGQLLTVILLFFLSFRDYPPGNPLKPARELLKYFARYRYLFLSGLFYYWGIWIDKIVYWLTVGEKVPGSFIKLFDLYDIPVYLANLTMIPGLIYFVVVAETDFYLLLKAFLNSIGRDIYKTIQERKYKLIARMKEGVREQSIFQGVMTVVFMLIAPVISESLFGGSLDAGILRLTLAAVFFQLLFLTLMTLLFYFELYRATALSAFIYFLVNLSGSLLSLLVPGLALFGVSYLAAGVSASFAAGAFLFSASGSFERLILGRYA
ncbi:MAG: hypothetical protein GH155_02735 [Spirochaeta sp.]|nr:hypothetical protein [Spirochaeta sp.]